MNLAMWVLVFLVDGWEGKGDGFDVKAFWTQDSCEKALAMVKDKSLIENGTRYKGRYTCIYEPEWNKWDRGVEKEIKP